MIKPLAQVLETIKKANGGILRPEDVVTAARPKTSPLHSRFQWDDSKAAESYRLWQARQLIVEVTVILAENPKKEDTQVYVSLPSDRASGGGYRAIVDVLNDVGQRQELLGAAFAEMAGFKKKYKGLKELAGVFAAIESLMT